MLPPLPSWEAIHVIYIHLPLGILPVAPILIILGLLWPRRRQSFMISAFVLMLLGTVGAYLAVATGEASYELAPATGPIHEVIEEHEELGEWARTLFTVLTVAFLILIMLPSLRKEALRKGVHLGLYVVFLICYAGALVVLAWAGHYGGMIVHQYRWTVGWDLPAHEHKQEEEGELTVGEVEEAEEEAEVDPTPEPAPTEPTPDVGSALTSPTTGADARTTPTQAPSAAAEAGVTPTTDSEPTTP